MQPNILTQLSQTTTFSASLITLLETLRKSLNTPSRWPRSSLKQIEHYLISLTCQNKNLLHYRYLEERGANQRCLAYIIEILTHLAKLYRESRENIVGLFLSHVISHTSCYISYYTFYIIIEAVPDMISEISHQNLLQINTKLKRQQNGQNFKVLQSIRISQSQSFTPQNIQLCQKNLDNFLITQSKPSTQTPTPSNSRHPQPKIPPLIIPTSKSINSSRYSAISRQEKRKGLADLQKLASNLGEGFITVQLGCLLANKRTRQVQEFSEDQGFRDRCMEKLERMETERMNSSRLTMHKGLVNENQDGQQNAKKYYRKVLLVNLNILLRKLPQKFKIMQWISKNISQSKKKTQPTSQQATQSQVLIHHLHQILDMSIVGMLNLQPLSKTHTRTSKKPNIFINNQSDMFSILSRSLKPINQVVGELMLKVSLESEKLHMNLLLNRNKADGMSHFVMDDQEGDKHDEDGEGIEIGDQFLDGVTLRVNQSTRADGPWKDYKKILAIKKYSDPILLYLGSWLQSLQQQADMTHPLFYFYQSNTLKSIAFYLNCTQGKISHYYCAQYLFRFLIMIKRQILQLSHPFISSLQLSSSTSLDPFKNQSSSYSNTNSHNQSHSHSKYPLSHKYSDLLENFLVIITALLEGSSKHLQKLIANVFIKNVYFMEVLQDYFQFLVKQENIPAISHVLKFYSKALEVYTNSAKKSHSSANKISENTPTYFLFQSISDYLCPKNGCIAKILNKYQSFISPSSLDQYDQQQNANQQNKFHTDTSSGMLDLTKNSQYTIQSYLHQIFIFISNIYYLASPSNQDSLPILQQQISSYYIKYSIMNFIKLYSLLTVTELANISMSNHATQQQDYMPSTKQSPHYTPKINTKQIFMIDFLKILTNISINRTAEIGKKFRQYRVLEFFVREIQLEFSVKENIEKYVKKAGKLREVAQVLKKNQDRLKQMEDSKLSKNLDKKASEGKKQLVQKKMTVPGLNLTGQLFKKQSQQPKSKQLNSTLNKKQKKLIPTLNIPVKTEQSIQKGGKKGFLDDMLQQIATKNSNPKKKSFKQQLSLKLDNLTINSKQKFNIGKAKSSKQSSDSSMIYYTQRKIRKIYSNKILHAQSIMLILSLILFKGQLDPIYCSQMPISQGKLNILYILHYHLNHQKNKPIVSILCQSVSKIKPYLSGQRLFKLLSNHFTDLSHYYDWTKINAGAFGVIMGAKTNIIQPNEVAIKQMNFPKSIYERSVLNDIFTEITILEMFRLEDRVTRMYNYGVIDNTYVIIMKRYHCSLRDWRLNNVQLPQSKLFPPTLPNILSLFYQILKSLKLLHQQNITHYDIKADNILLEFLPSQDPKQPPKVNVVFADFGVAKYFEDERDELDLKSRGTECIKSPEMITVTEDVKKEKDDYDRRKKIGTTRAADVWALGCLLYEIVAGEYLFNSNDWVKFYMQVKSPNEQILTVQNCQKMKNNIYLIDFIKYILIRDPQHRPSIHNILTRFQSLYTLLVANPERTASSNLREVNSKSLDELVREYRKFVRKEISQGSGMGGVVAESKRLKSEGEFGRTRKVYELLNLRFSGKLVKIMQDIYFCEKEIQVVEYQQTVKKQGITHIIIQNKSKINKQKFKVIQINFNKSPTMGQVYKLAPRVSDLLRQVLLMKGKLLFVNSQSNFCVNLLIFTLSYWFKCSAFETWCLINTQILEFPALASSVVSMSYGVNLLAKIQQEILDMPKLQCICGSVTIILKKKFNQKRGQVKVCKRKKNKTQTSSCFTKNCPAYLQLIQKRYNIIWDHLTWTLVSKSQLLTPLFNSTQQQITQCQIMLNSADPLHNMITESKSTDEWKLYQCRTCQMWILAANRDCSEVWLILNNLIKACRQGIMIPNAQQDFKARTPALNYYTLSKLHMTTQ